MGFLDFFKPNVPQVQSILPQAAVNEIMNGRLPILNTNKIFFAIVQCRTGMQSAGLPAVMCER